jgi:hypothetical protein
LTAEFNQSIFLAERIASFGDIFQLAILFFNKFVACLVFQSAARLIILFLIAQELPDILIPSLVKYRGNVHAHCKTFQENVIILPGIPLIALHVKTSAVQEIVNHNKKYGISQADHSHLNILNIEPNVCPINAVIQLNICTT